MWAGPQNGTLTGKENFIYIKEDLQVTSNVEEFVAFRNVGGACRLHGDGTMITPMGEGPVCLC